jgi:hypothetical protein
MSAAEAVGARDFTVEDGAISAFSSCTSSSSSSESLRMTTAENIVVEVTEEPPSELLIPWGVGEEIFLLWRRRKIHHWGLLGGTALLKYLWAVVAWGDLCRGP